MALAALIAAYHDADDAAGGLRATLPIAGRTLVERQARLAAAAGAHPVVIFVERVTSALAAAIDRLRAEGISARVARSVAQAAEAVDASDRLLLVGDGLIADPGQFARLAASGGTAVLTVPETAAEDRHERIDAESRWAGLALIDGALLRDTAAMLGDWDLQSTLLRRAVQSGARQIAAKSEPAEGFLTVARRADDLRRTEQDIVAASAAGARGWASRLLLAPAERLLTRLLMPTSMTPAWLHVGAVVATGLAALLFARGWLWAGGLLILVSTPLDGAAQRLGLMRLQPLRTGGWWNEILPALSAAALATLGYRLSLVHGWGCALLAVITILFVLALRIETAGRDFADREWLAERKGMAWLMLPFAAAGLWHYGLGAIAVYAAISFFWAQRVVHDSRAPD